MLYNAWNTILVVTSVVLLAYWFRYACLLVLRNGSTQSYAVRVAAANQLNLSAVQAQLANPQSIEEPDRLRELLAHDYRLLSYLIEHGSSFRTAGRRLERWVLSVDFQMMRLSYTLSRRIASSQGIEALREMADIVNHLANTMGREASLAAVR